MMSKVIEGFKFFFEEQTRADAITYGVLLGVIVIGVIALVVMTIKYLRED